MFETIIGLIVSGISALMSSALAGGREATAREENFALNEKAAENADKRTRQLYTDIQSPSAMLQQYKEAGLSPSMMFGGSGIGGQTSSGAQGAGASGISPAAFGISSPYDALTQSEIKLKKAETENVEAQTETINGENERGFAEIHNILLNNMNMGLKNQTQRLDNELKEIDKEIAEATKQAHIDIEKMSFMKLKYEALHEFALLDYQESQNEIAEAEANNAKEYYKNQVLEQCARIVELQTRTALEKAGIKLNNEQCKKLINDVVIDNQEIVLKGQQVEIDQNKLEAQIEQWLAENELVKRGQNISIIKDVTHAVAGFAKKAIPLLRIFE